jgi:hypothetical protein
MAIAASLLRGEMRRHLLMNFSLVASCVVAGTVVTNERGLFVPLTHGASETARAFSAMFTQSHLLPDNNELTDVRMVSPLSPFEVTADSRDLRRRLMDSLSGFGDDAAANNTELSKLSDQTITPTELATNNVPQSALTTPAATQGKEAAPTSTPAPSPTPTDTSVLPPTTNKPTSPDVTPEQAKTAQTDPTPPDDTGAVPEPSTWAMLIAGFGFVGYFLRNARRRALALVPDANA